MSACIPMSQIIASDAPVLEESWDQFPSNPTDHFPFSNYYNTPPSPPHSIGSTSTDASIPTAKMLKMRMSPDFGSDCEQLCLPTHQLFDLPEVSTHSSSSSPAPSSPKPTRLSITINHPPQPQKRAGPDPDATMTKKPRASGERISSKDFIPPDVSGLSKREARLVKNRAAAFLSRQRKREEFECMEARVAELEQENARLLSLTQSGDGGSRSSDSDVITALEQLRAQLAAAEERERELSAELARKSAARDAPVKVETIEPSRPTSVQSPHKSAASLGLMVLLCALPTLLSMPTQSTLSASSPYPVSASSLLASSSSTFDFNTLIPNEFDWSRHPESAAFMDLDTDDQNGLSSSTSSSTTKTRKLEFVDGALRGLSGLDISFDTSPSDDGKIRVRIHSPVPTELGSSSALHSSKIDPSLSSTSWIKTESMSDFEATLSSDSIYPPYASTAGAGDPFFGVGLGSHYSSDCTLPMSMFGDDEELSSSGFGVGSSLNLKKRRVRIALKSFPAAGGEGGEWEVQFC